MPMVVGSLLFAAGVPLAVVNFFAINAIGQALVWTAVSIGVNLATNALAGRPQQPELKPSDLQSPINQAVPPRIRSYGRVKMAGVVFWRAATSARPSTLYLGQIVNDGKIGGFVAFYIDDNAVLVNASTSTVQTWPYNNSVTTKIYSHVGLATETAYADLATAFGYANVRGDGLASYLFTGQNFVDTTTQSQNYPNGVPRVHATFDASLVWDPRSGSQSRTDDSTWVASSGANPVLAALDYMMHADGFALPWSRFEGNIAQWKACADHCDELVDGEPRYALSLTYDANQSPGDVLEQIKRAADMRIWPKSDGTIGISVGTLVDDSAEITTSDIIAGRIRRGQDALTGVAGVRARYKSPVRGHIETDAEPYPSAAEVVALDEDRVFSMALEMVPSERQARDLMEIEYLRQTAARRVSLTMSLAGLKLIDRRWCRLTWPSRGVDRVTFEIQDLQIDLPGGRVRAELVEWTTPAGTRSDPALQWAGAGFYGSTGVATPSFDYSTIITGRAPKVGDVVVWVLQGGATPTWTPGPGWVVAGTLLDANNEYHAIIAKKMVSDGDLAAISPFVGLGGGQYAEGHWQVFSGAPSTGTLTSTLFSGLAAPNNGDPASVSIDTSSIAAFPRIVVSGHTTRPDAANLLASAQWTGEVPSGRSVANANSSPVIAIAVLSKTYDAGDDAPTVVADMGDEGLANYQAVTAFHFA